MNRVFDSNKHAWGVNSSWLRAGSVAAAAGELEVRLPKAVASTDPPAWCREAVGLARLRAAHRVVCVRVEYDRPRLAWTPVGTSERAVGVRVRASPTLAPPGVTYEESRRETRVCVR